MCRNDFVLLEEISSANDLIQILNIGNVVFRQSYLMQIELPTLLNVLVTDHELE